MKGQMNSHYTECKFSKFKHTMVKHSVKECVELMRGHWSKSSDFQLKKKRWRVIAFCVVVGGGR